MGKGREGIRHHRPVSGHPWQQHIRLVLGFSPGSVSDEIARAIVEPLSAHLGKPVEIELLPGENGATAAQQVAASVPDGDTLFMATLGTHALAPHLSRKPAYHPLSDFAPVSLVTQSPLLLACHPSIPAASTRELIELARMHPGELTYASSAIGGAPHLAAELFQAMSGIKMRHVRYDETRQLYRDLEAGRVSLSFNNVMSMLPPCERGALRALAITSSKRNPAAPEIPTIAECGMDGYEVTNWLGIVAPKATPESTIARLSAAVAAAVQSDPVRNMLRAAGVVPCGSTPAEFARFIAGELDRWGPIVKRFRDTA